MSHPLTDVCVLERPLVKCKKQKSGCLFSFHFLHHRHQRRPQYPLFSLSRLSFPLFNVSCFPFDRCVICSLYAVRMCVSASASERLWVRRLHVVGVNMADPCVGPLSSVRLCRKLTASRPGEPIWVRPLKVASGCCAFKHMLSHADRQAGRQTCMYENTAGALLQARVCCLSTDRAFYPLNNGTHCGLDVDLTAFSAAKRPCWYW